MRLSTRLMVLALTIVLPALAIIIYDDVSERAGSRARALTDMQHTAQLAANQQAAVFDGARRLLLTLAQVPTIRDEDPSACNALLASVLQDHPAYVNLAVVSAT